MQELVNVNSELSAALSQTLTYLRDSMQIVVRGISTQLAYFSKQVSWAVTYNIIDLLDYMFDLYSYEWVYANKSLQEITNWIDTLALNKMYDIFDTLNNFTALTDIIIENFADKLEEIDLGIDPYYNERMFAIYGRIAEVSEAIDAPPFYLEEVIQNARFFALSLACSSGLSYYQFQSEWNDNIDKLLIRISNQINLYSQNPQWIKFDIENTIIKPLYEIEKNKQQEKRELFNTLTDKVDNGIDLLLSIEQNVIENRYIIDNLFELEIAPKLKELKDSFDNWIKDIYSQDNKLNATRHAIFTIGISNLFEKIAGVLGLLDYGGDLLLRVNKLTEILRIEQEDKIGEVTTRSFRRLVPEWTAEVKKGIG